MKRDALAILIIGMSIGIAMVALAEVVDRTPGGMHPTWHPAPSATPASVPARPLRTATQGTP